MNNAVNLQTQISTVLVLSLCWTLGKPGHQASGYFGVGGGDLVQSGATHGDCTETEEETAREKSFALVEHRLQFECFLDSLVSTRYSAWINTNLIAHSLQHLFSQSTHCWMQRTACFLAIATNWLGSQNISQIISWYQYHADNIWYYEIKLW